MPCRVMKPLDYNANNSYPVIVSLHGAGGRGTNNGKQLKDWNRQLAEPQRRKDFPCYVVAPQANELWNAGHLNKIKSLIRTLPSVARDRIYVMGHSMGGHGTYIFIQLDTEYFAAAAPSAGAGKKNTEDFISAEKIRDIPIWAFHGDEDRVCPYGKDRSVFREVSNLAGNMKLTTWAGDGHGVSGKMIPGADNGATEVSGDRCDQEPDLMTWLFSQSRQLNEFDQQANEVQNLIERRSETFGLDRTQREAQYLAKTISNIRELRSTRGRLLTLIGDAEGPLRSKLQTQADRFQAQVEADEELIRLIMRVMKAPADEVEDLEIEIGDLVSELEGVRAKSTPPETFPSPPMPSSQTGVLKSGEYFISQTWSQQRNFRRAYFVNVPESTSDNSAKLPVFVFLHGNGGNAREAMRGWLRNRKKIASRYILVFAQGYRESWNIVSERSRANDLGFIESVVQELTMYENVSPRDFTIMGASNGAAMVNQLAIESRLPNIRNYISGVSPLNVWQYDGKQFKAKGDDNNYRTAVVPLTGRRLMNISGADDKLVPYDGGPSKVIPAKSGKLAFVPAEESTFLWAKAMGYEGDQLSEPTSTTGKTEFFSYLGGDVIHCKVNDAGHGATHEISEPALLKFLQGGDVDPDLSNADRTSDTNRAADF
ncbi:MAG: hypothetical protein GY826_38885 [Fuerstiella sp.]|nr:hypothetical protein [Fuerstiella sp.]